MKYVYARVSTDGQSVDAQVRQLTKAGCKKVFREVASGAKTDGSQLRRVLDQLEACDVLMVTRLVPEGHFVHSGRVICADP
jgi:DNA invertase Pin-like site-specific DNA recombinase